MTARQVVGAAVFGMLAPVLATAQTVRGLVIDRANTPVPGVVVRLLDSTSAIGARALTNDRGEFRLIAVRPGTYHLSTLRIGFRPVLSAPIVLRLGEEVTERIELAGVAFALDTVRVDSRSACRLARDSAAATFAVWEQVRSALTATQVTASTRAIVVTMVTYERSLDPGGRQTLQQRAVARTDSVAQPWRSLTPDSLRRVGYVGAGAGDSTIYRAPGLDMLESGAFVEDHCFRLTSSRDKSRIGISFEPTPDRRHSSEIRGTLWLDRASSELRSLEFRYLNLDPMQEDAGAGGTMDFARLKSGAWVISRWSIRMPVLEQRLVGGRGGRARVPETSVGSIRVEGGELALARAGTDTLWAHAPITLAGTVTDSVAGTAVPAARVSLQETAFAAMTDAAGRFSIGGLMPGAYTLEIHTASLDSMNAVNRLAMVLVDSGVAVQLRVPNAQAIATAFCGTATRRMTASGLPGIIVGSVEILGDTAAPPTLKVVAEWNEAAGKGRRLEVPTDAAGGYRLCGVPVGAAIALRAAADSGSGDVVNVRIEPGGRFARAALALDRNAGPVAEFMGFVSDSSRRPIAGVEVVLPGLAKSAVTSERGAFVLRDVPAGSHRVVVRHVGYGPLDTLLRFPANQTVTTDVILSHITVLDSVVVSAPQPWLRDFEENRKLGLGHFITRDQLAKQEDRRLSEILSEVPSLQIIQGGGNKAWLSRMRGVPSLNRECVQLEGRGTVQQMCNYCYAQVYVDAVLMYAGGSRGEVPNINRFWAGDIEAIEYYAGGAQTPSKYANLNSNCGVLVIHTRRSP
jgi:carboxypeptidase family protein/TonB-dependent receptor-like protein